MFIDYALRFWIICFANKQSVNYLSRLLFASRIFIVQPIVYIKLSRSSEQNDGISGHHHHVRLSVQVSQIPRQESYRKLVE